MREKRDYTVSEGEKRLQYEGEKRLHCEGGRKEITI